MQFNSCNCRLRWFLIFRCCRFTLVFVFFCFRFVLRFLVVYPTPRWSSYLVCAFSLEASDSSSVCRLCLSSGLCFPQAIGNSFPHAFSLFGPSQSVLRCVNGVGVASCVFSLMSLLPLVVFFRCSRVCVMPSSSARINDDHLVCLFALGAISAPPRNRSNTCCGLCLAKFVDGQCHAPTAVDHPRSHAAASQPRKEIMCDDTFQPFPSGQEGQAQVSR